METCTTAWNKSVAKRGGKLRGGEGVEGTESVVVVVGVVAVVVVVGVVVVVAVVVVVVVGVSVVVAGVVEGVEEAGRGVAGGAGTGEPQSIAHVQRESL